jgi:hypothetical protein
MGFTPTDILLHNGERNEPGYRMRLVPVIIIFVVVMALFSGCVTQPQNPGITVSSLDTADIPQIAIGSFDAYTESFQIENPTNRTLTNVEVDLNIIPVTAYCHQQEKTLSYPSISPKQKIIEQISFLEFSGLDCQYSYTFKASAQN